MYWSVDRSVFGPFSLSVCGWSVCGPVFRAGPLSPDLLCVSLGVKADAVLYSLLVCPDGSGPITVPFGSGSGCAWRYLVLARVLLGAGLSSGLVPWYFSAFSALCWKTFGLNKI